MIITKKMLIGDLVEKHREAAVLLMKYGLHCIGCHVSKHESIEEGCKAHGLSEEDIIKMINEMNELIQEN